MLSLISLSSVVSSFSSTIGGSSAFLVIFLTFLVLGWLLQNRPSKLDDPRLPPGPKVGLFFSNWNLLHGHPRVYQTINKLANEYGRIYTLLLGSQRVIVLTDPKLVKEAFVTRAEEFSERNYWRPAVRYITRGRGLINGHNWRKLRRIALSAMRDFGLGRQTLEARIQEEIGYLIAEIDKLSGKPTNLEPLIEHAASNVICIVAFGRRFPTDDKDFKRLMRKLSESMSLNGWKTRAFFETVAFFYSIAKSVITRGTFFESERFVLRQIKEHRLTYDPTCMRDFVDLFIKAEKEDGHGISGADLFWTIDDLFIAGSITTKSTIMVALFYVSLHLHIQTKCRTEIHRVVGTSRIPNSQDRKHLNYVEAMIVETQRLASILPVGLIHVAKDDTYLGGYFIPKRSIVVPNIYGMHMDPVVFKDPETFNPERWLDDKGDLITSESYMPFSMGPRVCLGEALAKNEMFLFLSTLMQQFEFRLHDPSHCPNPLNVEQGLTRSLGSFDIIATRV